METAAQLSHPAPLLESLAIEAESESSSQWSHAIPSTLFGGDLSSLRKLCLERISTVLPWRNMINLTSFTLRGTAPGDLPIGNLLDFFESAPNLCDIELRSMALSPGVQSGRLASFGCLKRMVIEGGLPSLLLDYLLIPIGTELTTMGSRFSFDYTIDHLLPDSLDKLRNLSGFTEIQLRVDEFSLCIKFIGPNGKLSLSHITPSLDSTIPALESLAKFDTSKAEQLKMVVGCFPTEGYIYRALLPMANLRVLTLSQCRYVSSFMQALRAGMSSSEVVVCPKLEELIIVLRGWGEAFNIRDVIGVAMVRESGGAKLRTVRIVGKLDKQDTRGVSELGKHVLHVDIHPGASGADGDSDGGYNDNTSDEGGDDSIGDDDESGDYRDQDSDGDNEED